jgi:hypothetical protein
MSTWTTTAQWYSAGLRAGWLEVRVPAEAGNFSLHHCVQTGSGAHPTSYPMGTKGSCPGGKAGGAWSWTSSVEVKNAWSYTSTRPITPSWRGAQLKHRDNFTFTFTRLAPTINWHQWQWDVQNHKHNVWKACTPDWSIHFHSCDSRQILLNKYIKKRRILLHRITPPTSF